MHASWLSKNECCIYFSSSLIISAGQKTRSQRLYWDLEFFFALLVTCKFNMTGWTESLNEVTLAPIPFPWIGDLGSVLRRRGTEQDSNDQAVKKYWNSIIRDEG